MKKSKKKSAANRQQNSEQYAHNPHYCMIAPDTTQKDDVVSTGQS